MWRGVSGRCGARAAGLWILIATLLTAATAHAEDPVAVTRAALALAIRRAEAAARPPTVERERFLRQPSIVDVRLAADGRELAYLTRSGSRVDAIVRRLADGSETKLQTGSESLEIDWASDSTGLWLADEHGLSWFSVATRSAKRIYRWPAHRRQSFFGVDPQSTHALVVEPPTPGTSHLFRYWRIDRRGESRLLYESATKLHRLLLRADGSLAFTGGMEGAIYDTVIRHHQGGQGREILRCPGPEVCRVLRSSADGDSLWIRSQHREDRQVLARWQLSTGQFANLHRDPHGIADLEMALWAGSTLMAAAYDCGRQHWEAAAPGTAAGRSIASALATLAAKLPDAALQLSASADGKTWLVRAQHESWAEDRYYLYEPALFVGAASSTATNHATTAKTRLDQLFVAEQATAIPEASLANLVPLRYRASDGFLVHGYVLLPKGRPLGEVPLIAWLHGGPVARLHAHHDPRLQLLANRGYAVFLPNFRGSSGYGLRYQQAAAADVGNGRVLADVIDGLDFLLAAGVGARTRQAVAGHSFGGYLSLVAATFHPERFTFAVAIAPPTEYGWMKQWQAEHDSEALHGDGPPLAVALPQHGYRYQEAAWREKMARESPRHNVAAIQVPIYLWAGAQDAHVPLESVGHYAGELGRLRKPFTILIDPDAGHSPTTARSADAYLYLLEHAAHRHFGGPLSPPTAELQGFLRRHLQVKSAL